MKLEAVWYKKGKEIHKISPVMNIVCEDNMESISEIEIENNGEWYSYEDADNFVIRVKKN